jgi:transglutaminase-like putative cysteine protease
MKTPPLLMGVTLLFWGWQTGRPWLGALAAVVLEGGRQARWQWDLSEAELARIWDLCVLLAAGLFLFTYGSEEVTRSVYVFVQWLPLVFLPMILAQWFGTLDRLPYQTFSWRIRRSQKKHNLGTGHATATPAVVRVPQQVGRPLVAVSGMNVTYPYFTLCLLATSAANPEQIWFYPGLCLLSAWPLLMTRPRRLPIWVWGLALAAAGLLGFYAHQGLRTVQNVVEGKIGAWVNALVRKDLDSNESHTAMGQIGKIKLSGRIVVRLETEAGCAAPPLLREASYKALRRTTWLGSRDYFGVVPEPNDAWTLLQDKKSARTVTIARYLKRGKGVLPLPSGTARIENLPALDMECSSLGVVRVDDAPGFVCFRARYGPGTTMDSLPDKGDFEVAKEEEEAVVQVVEELKLSDKQPRAILSAINDHFQTRFNYSTWLAGPVTGSTNRLTPLGDFLLQRRSGHCEYFASAAVLLLREAGLAARYATGYAVQERAGDNRYVVRERHAHAWCLVHIDGHWEDFDPTPASWNRLEAGRASWFEPLSDFWSWLRYQFSQWRWGQSGLRQYLLWLLIPLALVLLWRIFFRKRRIPPETTGDAAWVQTHLHGSDSEFYFIEHRLGRRGLARFPGETLTAWCLRIEPAMDGAGESLRSIIALHYRYRFDPQGLAPADRQSLNTLVLDWLQHH